MNKQQIRFIVNPISGKSHKKHLARQIEENIDNTLFEYEIAISQYAGHAKLLAREAVERHFDIIAVAGGDGSINEVGSQLIGTDVALALLPCGSGNGLSRCLNIPLSASKALKIINNNYRKKIDTVTINDTPFLSIAGTGYDAKVAESYSKDIHRGFDTYLKYIIQNYFRMEEEEYTIQLPDCSFDTKAFFISFANSNQMGYDIPISPNASLEDGKVDICIVRKPNALELPIMGAFFLNKDMDKAPKVNILQVPEVVIIRPQADVINLDGESVMMDKDLHIKVNPSSLTIICNEK